MSLISDYFPSKRRGMALGLFNSSTSLGTAAGFAIGGLIASKLDWRAAFFIAGAPGLVFAALAIATIAEPRRGGLDHGPGTAAKQEKSSLLSMVRLIWTDKALAFILLGAMPIAMALSGITAFLAPYFIRVHEMPIHSAGLAVAATLGGGGLLAMPLGGFLSDRLARRSEAQVPLFVAVAMVVAALCTIAALYVSSLSLSLAFMTLMAISSLLFQVPTYRTYLNHTPVAMRGRGRCIFDVHVEPRRLWSRPSFHRRIQRLFPADGSGTAVARSSDTDGDFLPSRCARLLFRKSLSGEAIA
jgi:predicted MFS family arabinose efflux permease